MELYTFIMAFRGGTYISQIHAPQLPEAIKLWGDNLEIKDIQYIKTAGKLQLIKELVDIDYVTLDSLRNAWFFCLHIRAGFIMVNVIKTNTIQDVNSKY